jgi:sugar phosphate isomerase/epimerase
MGIQIALQLYTLRKEAEKDYAGMVRKVAEIGYQGVETDKYPGTTSEAAGKLFKELGLTVTSAHAGLPLGDKKNEILDGLEAIGCRHLVKATMIHPDEAGSLDKIRAVCEEMNTANNILKSRGIRLGAHNHILEFTRIGNRFIYQVMQEFLDPDITFELDTYWIKTAGVDPVKIVKEMGARSPLLHIKDGPAAKGVPQVAVGRGVMDFPAIFAASGKNLEWAIVELDECATNMLEAVDASFCYLKGTC